jgi:transposase
MPRKERPSFIVTLPLDTSSRDVSKLRDRVECGKRIHNATLQAGLRIVDAVRGDLRWATAQKMPRGSARNEVFKAVRASHGFSEYEFHAIAVVHKNAAGFDTRIGSHETQKIASRVFAALEQYLFGVRGRPRFKGVKRPLHSLEGKNNEGMLRWNAEAGVVQIERGWTIPVKMPDLRKDEWLAAALQARTKYCRLVWRVVHGEQRWFVQLVQDGRTPLKASVLKRLAPDGTVGGLDIGPSTIAWVTDREAGVQRFAPDVDRPHREVRRLQRHIDRQRRSNNPVNYHPDGRARKGCRNWVRSLRQLTVERRLAEVLRYEADVRKQAHGRDINNLLSKALTWRDDGVSPKALQKRYGRSVSVRAPGHFMQELTRKAERAGGQRQVIDVYRLKTSQYDHSTNTFRKKKLSERWHVFGDGRGRVQRDLYSAFLARSSEGNTHQPLALEKAWHELASLLQQAGWYVIKPQEAGFASPRTDFAVRQSGSSESSGEMQQEALPV